MKKRQESFSLTSITREDVKLALEEAGETDLALMVESLSDSTMRQIARDLANDYMDQMMWSSLATVAINRISRPNL